MILSENMIENKYLQKLFENANVTMNRPSETYGWKWLDTDRTFCLYEWILFLADRLDNCTAEVVIENLEQESDKNKYFIIKHNACTDILRDLFTSGLGFRKVCSILWCMMSNNSKLWKFIIYLYKEGQNE